jgi:hypothetical protein
VPELPTFEPHALVSFMPKCARFLAALKRDRGPASMVWHGRRGSQHERGSASPLGAALRVRAATLSAGRSSVAAARRIVNPPIMACCAGVLCGSIPVLKHLFVGDGAPLGLVRVREPPAARARPDSGGKRAKDIVR